MSKATTFKAKNAALLVTLSLVCTVPAAADGAPTEIAEIIDADHRRVEVESSLRALP